MVRLSPLCFGESWGRGNGKNPAPRAQPTDLHRDVHLRIPCHWRSRAPTMDATIADRFGACLVNSAHPDDR
jgi:hypothetical protein